MPDHREANNLNTTGATSRFSSQQWGLLLLLAAINFTHILDFVIVMPLGDPLRQQLHITPKQFGMVVSAYGIAAMFMGIVSSSVVDLFDRKTILIVSFGGMASSCVMAVIGDVFTDRQRGRAIGAVIMTLIITNLPSISLLSATLVLSFCLRSFRPANL